jgi:hypothetical protein
MDHDLPLPVSASHSVDDRSRQEGTNVSEPRPATGFVKKLKRSLTFGGSQSKRISAALVFNIHTIQKSRFRGRTFTLQCNSPADCLEWMEILRKAVSKARRSSALVSFHQKFQASSSIPPSLDSFLLALHRIRSPRSRHPTTRKRPVCPYCSHCIMYLFSAVQNNLFALMSVAVLVRKPPKLRQSATVHAQRLCRSRDCRRSGLSNSLIGVRRG